MNNSALSQSRSEARLLASPAAISRQPEDAATSLCRRESHPPPLLQVLLVASLTLSRRVAETDFRPQPGAQEGPSACRLRRHAPRPLALRYAFHPTVPLPFARRSALPLRIPAAGKMLPGLLFRISNMKQKPVRARMGALYS